MYNATRQKNKLVPLVILIVLCAALAGLLLLRRGAETRAALAPEPTPTPAPTAAAEVTAAPIETPAPTDAPTPTPPTTEEPAATEEPEEAEETEEPGEATPSPTPIVSQTGGVGTYTWKDGEDEWTLTLRDNGTYTLMDPSGYPHTGESWSVGEDGTVSCGPTDLYDVDWSYSGGCSHWYFPSWQMCAPVR